MVKTWPQPHSQRLRKKPPVAGCLPFYSSLSSPVRPGLGNTSGKQETKASLWEVPEDGLLFLCPQFQTELLF